jgi:glycosyltransferase involved in cell wall biosynthesis
MSRPIIYDMLRLMLAPFSPTPRGIDRIDFGYAKYLHSDWPAPFMGLAPTPWGMRCFDRNKLSHGIARTDQLWLETQDRETDPVYSDIKAFLSGSVRDAAHHTKPNAALSTSRELLAFIDLMLAGPWSFGLSARNVPKDSIYLNIGHYGLSVPLFLNWLKARPDVRKVFLLHDIIPLEVPHLVAPSTVRAHQSVMEAVIAHADALIVPSEATKQSTLTELRKRGVREMPIHALGLPMNEAFITPQDPDPALSARPYFVICGAIETRKNHKLLFDIWQKLVQARGAKAPALIVAGPPGFQGQEIVNDLASRDDLKGSVHLAHGLSTSALRSLMASAEGLLMPSFTEGFGLPPVEALTLGTPAIVSNIDAHKEVTGEYGLWLDPHDERSWLDTITGLLDDPQAKQALRAKIARFKPQTWASYMREVSSVLENID